ncbi:UDP-N-acetylglucosamine 2-epimerase (hydrolyzing) [Flavobacteriaceae bacterium Ap0902]|nr:UDP-N-acetylglucosamine 2-epimerase (hydrolyzing) [Flavobacteriaceae bacterium Ap0902]
MNKKIKIAFFTGARSEYGILRKLLFELQENSNFEISLIVGGMHLLANYGNTIQEIRKDGFKIDAELNFYSNNAEPTFDNFTKAINMISEHLTLDKYDALFIVGDRLEAYSAALAAHLTNTSIIHSGGGTLTKGANDNIYRYNISNLANYHLTTSRGNYNRLMKLPILKKENIFFTGSVAIDSIKKFQIENTRNISDYFENLKPNNFVLITYHSATNSEENIPLMLKTSVNFLLDNGVKVLITYPNNDTGSKSIIKEIELLEQNPNVITSKSLGAYKYYIALQDCMFVLGNSSSGIIEAPYFNKMVINVGSRQEGREKDNLVLDVPAERQNVEDAIIKLINNKQNNSLPENIYGSGDSISKVIKVLLMLKNK